MHALSLFFAVRSATTAGVHAGSGFLLVSLGPGLACMLKVVVACPSSLTLTSVSRLSPGVVERVGDLKTRLQAVACLTALSEAVGPRFVFERVRTVPTLALLWHQIPSCDFSLVLRWQPPGNLARCLSAVDYSAHASESAPAATSCFSSPLEFRPDRAPPWPRDHNNRLVTCSDPTDTSFCLILCASLLLSLQGSSAAGGHKNLKVLEGFLSWTMGAVEDFGSAEFDLKVSKQLLPSEHTAECLNPPASV